MRHVHIIEPLPLGHGPLWLKFFIDALLPRVKNLTITFPDFPAYEVLRNSKAAETGQLILRPVPWRTDKLSWRDTLSGAESLNADLSLLTYADVVLKKFRGDLRQKLAEPIWGIWYLPNPRRPASFWNPRRLVSGQARGHYRDQQILRKVPAWLSGAFVLDDSLKERITPRDNLAIQVLPDPWPSRPTMPKLEARERLNLPPESQIFLHFGVANPRKGLADACGAWEQLPDEENMILLRAGLTGAAELEALKPLMHKGRAILHNERIAEEKIDWYFRACDWVLLPYRFHEGSSGLLAAAAAAGRPVIASDHGVIGKRTKAEALGLCFPHLSIDGLKKAITRAASGNTEDYQDALTAYANEHGQQELSRKIRSAWGLPI